ncbi:MAG: hypothetical protein RLY31_985 [Bacteroidota bacterium]|jgi:hypothetical protein
MKKIILVLSLTWLSPAYAQYRMPDGISPGTGASNPAVSTLNPLHGNPAALPVHEGTAWMIAAGKQYVVSGLYSLKLAISRPVGRMRVASSFERHGYRDFISQQWGLWFARTISERLQGGIKLILLDRKFPGTIRKGNPGWEIGLLGKVLPRWRFGLHVIGYHAIRSGEPDGTGLFGSISQGMHWEIGTQLDLYLGARLSPENGISWFGGIVYAIDEKTDLKLGLAGSPMQPGISVGHRLSRQAVLDLGNRYHPVLGMSPALTFSNRPMLNSN